MRVKRVVSSFSLCLLAVAGLCQSTALEGKKDRELLRAVRELPVSSIPPALRSDWKMVRSTADAVAFRSKLQAITLEIDPKQVAAQAKEIKRSTLYVDKGEKHDSNWLSRAGERFGAFVKDILDRIFGRKIDAPDLDGVNINPPNMNWFITLVWILLAGAGVFLLYLAISRFRFQKNLARKARAVLDEDEPERTVDEWLQMADQLEREGRYREAVRCLYLACLLKFDEFGVARFDRGQTNWEHLDRISKSPKLPAGLDFREPTRRFDVIWYGIRCDGVSDVSRFRAIYEGLLEQLRPARAA